jgi:hypothetical protein
MIYHPQNAVVLVQHGLKLKTVHLQQASENSVKDYFTAAT